MRASLSIGRNGTSETMEADLLRLVVELKDTSYRPDDLNVLVVVRVKVV